MELTLSIPLIIFTGLFSALIASIMGLGGGIISIPIIMIIVNNHSQEAKIISYSSIILLSIVSIFKYWKYKKSPDLKNAFAIIVGVLPISAISVIYLSPILNTDKMKPYFQLIYAFVVLLVMLLINFKDKMKKRELPLWTLPLFGMIIGLLSGSLGLSGGVLYMPLLVIGLSMSLKKAAVTSLLLKLASATTNIIVSGVSGQFTSFAIDGIYQWLPLLILPGSFIGAIIGPRISKKITDRTMHIVFNIVMSLILMWEVVNSILLFTNVL